MVKIHSTSLRRPRLPAGGGLLGLAFLQVFIGASGDWTLRQEVNAFGVMAPSEYFHSEYYPWPQDYRYIYLALAAVILLLFRPLSENRTWALVAAGLVFCCGPLVFGWDGHNLSEPMTGRGD